jgi:hypothetical protein
MDGTYSDAYNAGYAMGQAFRMSTPMLIFSLVVAVFSIVCMWKVFKKAGRNGWEAIVPIYNIVVLFQISGVNPLHILWLLLPFVGSIVFLVFLIKAYINLAKSFGKSTGFVVGLVLLNVVFMAILAFDSSTYTAVAEAK